MKILNKVNKKMKNDMPIIYAPIKKRKVTFLQSFTTKAVQLFKAIAFLFLCALSYVVVSYLFPQYVHPAEVEKCKQFKKHISKEIGRYKNSPFTHSIVCGVMSVESSFRPHVTSKSGAVGIMQVTLHVLNDYNLYGKRKVPMLSHEMFNLQNNIMLGVWYLHRTHKHTKKYAGEESLPASLSAYYWGLTRAVDKKLTHTNYSKKVLNRHNYFEKLLHPRENTDYHVLTHTDTVKQENKMIITVLAAPEL